jgi:hypothetical protein
VPEFLLRVHHDRALLGDGLIERPSRHGASVSYDECRLTGKSDGGVNDPLQRSRLKIQFAFCLGIRYASHLSRVVNRIRTTIPFQSILN